LSWLLSILYFTMTILNSHPIGFRKITKMCE
jgi:hypothetical protein